MIDMKVLTAFTAPYYANKDIMHDMWHIALVKKTVDKIIALGTHEVDIDCLTLATYFHGFIYIAEREIRDWMKVQGYSDSMIEKSIRIAWESQRNEIPETLEGKILHDAHVLEGGRLYLVVKTLITGSVRGQSLQDTLSYMERNVLGSNKCYLPETILLCESMNQYTESFYHELMDSIS